MLPCTLLPCTALSGATLRCKPSSCTAVEAGRDWSAWRLSSNGLFTELLLYTILLLLTALWSVLSTVLLLALPSSSEPRYWCSMVLKLLLPCLSLLPGTPSAYRGEVPLGTSAASPVLALGAELTLVLAVPLMGAGAVLRFVLAVAVADMMKGLVRQSEGVPVASTGIARMTRPWRCFPPPVPCSQLPAPSSS